MINLKALNQPETLQAIRDNLAQRNYHLPDELLTLLTEQKAHFMAIEAFNARINRGEHTPEDKMVLKNHKAQYEALQAKIDAMTYLIPNILHETVPAGKGEHDNVQKVTFFDEKKKIIKEDHVELARHLGLNTQRGADLAQTRFTTMNGEIARLHRKLINLALDFYGALGYDEHYLPNLVNEQTITGTGQYPKFKEELFVTEGDRPLFLIPTGEVPLTNMVRDTMFKEKELNENRNATGLNLMTHTPCFRREAGAYGKDTKGIIRQHQFEKVELVKVCMPQDGEKALEKMVADVTDFITQLGIPFRIIELCAGDIGFAGHKAYDFEIWFPAQNQYREIASVTWCHDFQARRMNTKVKHNNGKKEYVHTLNGTGLAAGRVLAAIIENCVMDGKLILPDCLK
jgi:seryl-tRNA synthetase